MPQDAFTMRLAAKELNSLLCGGKINKITQPANDEIIFQIYAGGKNLNIAVSANAQCARICPTKGEFTNPAVAPNFCMLLRKHLSGATVSSVEACGFERVIFINFEAKNDFRENVAKQLACELMGKYSNVILTENGKILGTLKPPFGDIDGARVLFNDMPYTLPPAQEKIEITDKTRVLEAFYNFNGGSGSVFTANTIKGIATVTAKQAVLEFFGTDLIPSLTKELAEKFYGFLFEFITEPKLKPNATTQPPFDFFAVDCKTAGGEKIYFDTVLEAEGYCFDTAEKQRLFKQKYKAVSDKLKAYDKKLRKKLQIINEKELSCGDADINRIKGELLTAYGYAVPAGSKECELVNFYSETGEKIKIALDPDLSANRNAQNYFKKYAKQKKTIAAIAPQKDEILRSVDYLTDLYAELDRCEAPSDFEFLTEELKASGIIKNDAKAGKAKKKQPASCPKTFVFGGFTILAGRNNVQNDELTFSSERSDLWLHTKNIHSSHVIVRTLGKTVPDDVLLFAAEICAYYSKARGGNKVPVDYCLKRYVKKPPNAKPGGVIYTDFKTVLVDPSAHAESEKQNVSQKNSH